METAWIAGRLPKCHDTLEWGLLGIFSNRYLAARACYSDHCFVAEIMPNMIYPNDFNIEGKGVEYPLAKPTKKTTKRRVKKARRCGDAE